eukprot:6830284-Prymnesium_polylepis.1
MHAYSGGAAQGWSRDRLGLQPKNRPFSLTYGMDVVLVNGIIVPIGGAPDKVLHAIGRLLEMFGS